MFTKLLALLGLQKIPAKQELDPKEVEVIDPETVVPEKESVNLDEMDYEVQDVLEEESERLLEDYTASANIKLYRIPQNIMVGDKLKVMITVDTEGAILIHTALGEPVFLGKGWISRHFSPPAVETSWNAYIMISKIHRHFLGDREELRLFMMFKQFSGAKPGELKIVQHIPREVRGGYPDTFLGKGECRSDKTEIVREWLESVKS